MATLFVGNLAAAVTETGLKELFGRFGEVGAVSLPIERSTGRHRGFALVELVSGAEAAVRTLHGRVVNGRQLAVNPAHPRPVPAAKLVPAAKPA